MKALLKIIVFTVALLVSQNVFSQDSLNIQENILSINNFGLFQNNAEINAMGIQMRIMPLCDEHNRNYRPHPR
jgi:hypothetical protein